MKYNTYIGDSIKINSSGQLLWPTASMVNELVNDDVSEMVMM